MTAAADRLATRTFTAWSCSMRISVADARALDSAVQDVRLLLDRVEMAGSRFRADSALSIANRRAGRPTPVPRLLADLVGAALDSAAATDGAVDPTIGRALTRLGYDCDIDDVAGDGPAVAPVARHRGWRDVRLDREAGLLTVPVGTALDLGATAKAYTADLAARTVWDRYGVAALVELGGDVAVCGAPDGGWRVGVAEHAGGDGQVVTLTRGGIATSTTTIRRWRRGGSTVHHIVDPDTGCSAQPVWRTVSVHAESALAANTASTAAIVKGDVAVQWLLRNGVTARLVSSDGSVQHVGSWPAVHSSARIAAVA